MVKLTREEAFELLEIEVRVLVCLQRRRRSPEGAFVCGLLRDRARARLTPSLAPPPNTHIGDRG